MIRTYKIIWTGSLKWPSIVFHTHIILFFTQYSFTCHLHTAEANFIRVIDIQAPPPEKMQQNPPIFHQQKTTKTIAICLADFIFYIFKWGYLRFWLRYCFLTIKRNTRLHVERNYTTKSNIDWNLNQCNTYVNKNRTRTLST